MAELAHHADRGGRNNKLYRATIPPYDLAVKFTIRDDRDRAGREYHTLQALQAEQSATQDEMMMKYEHYIRLANALV